jgi:hypothetical protein
MRNKYAATLCFGLVVFLAAAACKSGPAPTDTLVPGAADTVQPVPDPNLGPPDAAAAKALDDARTRAENARKQALYLEGRTYFPEDWDAGESRYQSAGEAELSTLGGVKESTAQYNAAADIYDEITRKSLPLYAQAREKDVLEARAGAIEAGIAEVSPERLASADDTARRALAQYQGGDYYAAAESAFLALDLYKALKTGAAIYKIRQEIEEYNLGRYDPDNYALAEGMAAQALEDYDAGRVEKARSTAEDALPRYAGVLATGWAAFAVEQKTAADKERQAALDLKANVAVRNDFNAAAAVYNQGETAFRAKRYQDAVAFYAQSESLFSLARISAADKRRTAEEAIRAAEEKMAESDAAAQNAERILEGGEQ